ncbi:MAG: hypothetical protein OXI73_07510 [Rhodospirillales bacterium]|nr:hypothetical protein [Rhodospirillales bacterium]
MPRGGKEASRPERQSGRKREAVFRTEPFAVVFELGMLSPAITLETQPANHTLRLAQCDDGLGP